MLNKKSFVYFTLFASLLVFASAFETSAQKKKTEPKKDAVTEFWQKQRARAMEDRKATVGIDLEGVIVPEVLSVSIVKQKAKIVEMQKTGFSAPLDYADLAYRLSRGELIEVPFVTDDYLVEVGGMASSAPFTAFDYENQSVELKPTDAKYQTLKKLADNFGGTRYDLNDPIDRKALKIRLLRLLNPRAKVVLEELAAAYRQKFDRPLRVTSMVRSIEYQVDLSSVNDNAFLGRDPEMLPPHCTGLAFDIGYKQMTAEEQNFLLAKIADLEKNGVVDGVREVGVNAALHVFVYADGVAPKL